MDGADEKVFYDENCEIEYFWLWNHRVGKELREVHFGFARVTELRAD